MTDRMPEGFAELSFLAGGGEMGRRIREFSWSDTPFGSPAGWPQPLRLALSIALHSTFPTAIYWGPDLRLIYNDAWSPIPAERHPAALGQPAAQVWSDIWEVVGPQFEQVLQAGEGFSTYDQLLPMHRGGVARETYWNYSFTPIRGEDGSIVGILNQGHETTERVLAERRTIAERERLRRMFEQAPGFMAMLSGPDHVFELVNDAYRQLVGHRDVIGKPIQEALPEIAGQGFFELLDQVYGSGEAFVGMAMAVDLQHAPDAVGEQRFVDFVYQPIKAEDGVVSGVFVQGIDITEQKRLAEALQQLNDSLEERVRERTDELERVHEQLRQSQKLEAMGQLTGGVAHDFNNLLTPIIGSLDLLVRKGIGAEREQRLIGAALESAERAKTLVQRLLAFARRQPLQPGPVDVREVVTGMADLVSSTSGPRVRLEIEIGDDLPPALAERNQLEMAVLNLCVNARDAMPEGGVLSIRAHTADLVPHQPSRPRARYVMLSVSDSGLGMSEETAARAIEPFFSTKGVGRGTGLGLSMVHGLALQLGGELSIKSQLGLGTTVELYLPQAGAAATAPALPVGDAQPRGLGAGSVLLVDDEAAVRSTTADMLRDLGYEVHEVSDGAAALQALDRHVPDLVVTDHLMPGITGTELAQMVRERLPDVPTLIVSGYADLDGISPHLPRLTKPFRQYELAASLAALHPLKP